MSRCLCVVETALAAIVFVYVMKGAGESIYDINDMVTRRLNFRELSKYPGATIGGFLLRMCIPLDVLVLAGCAVWCVVWTGVRHSLCARRVKAAVDNIETISEGGINRPGRRSIDLYEYHDVITIGLRISKVVFVWINFQWLTLVPAVIIVGSVLSYSNNNWSVLNICELLFFFMYFFIFTILLCILVYCTVKSGEECRTQPLGLHARRLLFASTIVFAVVLYISPAPSTWRWSLMAIHAARVLILSVSLARQGDIDVELDGITERAGDMV